MNLGRDAHDPALGQFCLNNDSQLLFVSRGKVVDLFLQYTERMIRVRIFEAVAFLGVVFDEFLEML